MRCSLRKTWPLLAVALLCLPGRLPAAPAPDKAGDAYAYYYFDQPVQLELDRDQVAVFDREPLDAGELGRRLGAYAVSAGDVRMVGARGWHRLEPPKGAWLRTDTRALVEDMAGSGVVDFVSPVFRDKRDLPVIITDKILVGFGADVSDERAREIIHGAGAGVIEDRGWTTPGLYCVQTPCMNGFEVLDLANELAQRPDVLFAEPSKIQRGTRDLIPNDTYFSSLWGLHNTGQLGGTYDMDMDGPEAWDITTGSNDIIIVILDDGIQQNHPDINQIAGADFTNYNTGGDPYNECDNHGTSVAGCATARINNNQGVVGIAPSCFSAAAKIGVAIVPCNGHIDVQTDDLLDALQWVLDIGARVTSLSITLNEESSITFKYNDLYVNGVVNFTSSGNTGTNDLGYPGTLADVNAVGAITGNGFRAGFSTYGYGISFVGPGVEIRTTDRTGGAGYSSQSYTWVQGTSYSCPYAAGVAALVLSYDPGLSPAQVEQVMRDSATDRGSTGYDIYYGHGLVNAHEALLEAQEPPNPPGAFELLSPLDGTVGVSTEGTYFVWGEAAGADHYTLVIDDVPDFQSPEEYHTNLPAGFVLLGGFRPGTTYYWSVTAYNLDGSTVSSPAIASFETYIDCNGNGVTDSLDIADGTSEDCNENGRPDECDLVAGDYTFASVDLSPIYYGSPQSFTVDNAPTATSSVTLDFEGYGDFSFSHPYEYVDVELNGVYLDYVFGGIASDCPDEPNTDSITISAAQFNSIVGDGPAIVDMIASEGVDADVCDFPSYVSVALTYSGAAMSADVDGDGIPDECGGCGDQLLGDANCDGVVNNFDIDAFVLALTSGEGAWESAYGGAGCDFLCVADCNEDGTVNNFDIDAFVALLTGG